MLIFDMNTKEGREALAAHEQQRETMTAKGQRLYAKIKRSSKYYGQAKPHAIFPVYVDPRYGEYIVQGGPGGQYRLRDVNLFVCHDGRPLRIL